MEPAPDAAGEEAPFSDEPSKYDRDCGRVGQLEGALETARKALIKIRFLDYSHGATNGAAFQAYEIARDALAAITAAQKGGVK